MNAILTSGFSAAGRRIPGWPRPDRLCESGSTRPRRERPLERGGADIRKGPGLAGAERDGDDGLSGARVTPWFRRVVIRAASIP